MVLRSPMTISVRSPLNFLSCGSPPIAAWPTMWLSRPMRAGPCRLQCGPMRVPSPISTSAPTRVNAPMLTPRPMRAPGSTTALGWMETSATSVPGLRAEDLGAGGLRAVHTRHALVQGHVSDRAFELDLQLQAVARYDHLREFGFVDLDQVEHPAFRGAA